MTRVSRFFTFIAIAAALVLVGIYIGNMFPNDNRKYLKFIPFFIASWFISSSLSAPSSNSSLKIKGVRLAKVSLDQLEEMMKEIDAAAHRLSRTSPFDPYDPELLAAWNRKNPAKVKELLERGDRRTRTAAETLTTTLNMVAKHIDKARGNLARIIQQSEALLAKFGIKPDDTLLQRSGSYSMQIKPVLTSKIGVKQVNTRALSFNLSRIGMQVYNGNLSTSAGATGALAGIAIGLVTQAIFNSRALRRLKEAEGQLATQAEAVGGDLSTYRTALETQLRPHFNDLGALTLQMEDGISKLRKLPVSTVAPPELAFQLAFTLREAKHYLEQTG